MKRRALLQALPFVATAGLPAVAAAAPQTETTFRRIRRLQKELGVALAEMAAQPAGPSYVSLVLPEGSVSSNRWLQDRDLYQANQQRLALMGRIEVAALEWHLAIKAKAAAQDAYSGPDAPKGRLPADHPLRAAWIEADEVATQAQFRLLALVSQSVEGWG